MSIDLNNLSCVLNTKVNSNSTRVYFQIIKLISLATRYNNLLILRSIIQSVRFYIYSLEIINSSPMNFKTIEVLHDR